MVGSAIKNETTNALNQIFRILLTSPILQPPRVEYEYTDLARSLTSLFDTLIEWGEKHDEIISNSREKYDKRKS